MTAKTIEIRDEATFIPALAVRLEPGCSEDRYLLERAGFGSSPSDQRAYVLLVDINGGFGRATCDPYDWPARARTWRVAHEYVIAHFGELESGAVLDVQHILGETAAPKLSERLEAEATRLRVHLQTSVLEQTRGG